MTDTIYTVRTYRDRVADFFKAQPGVWIDGRELARIGGAYAWRTRVSDCRIDLGMVITNRKRKVGRTVFSEYKYEPQPIAADPPREGHNLNGWSLSGE